jgi:predicted nucleotidyltransferase
MDLEEPLANIMRVAEARILRVLAGTAAGLPLRHLARVANAPYTSAHSAVARLVSIGLIAEDVVPGGSALYRSNRDHLLWPAIDIALNARAELERRIVDFTHASAPAGTAVAIYGSQARGDSSALSDVDLLVVVGDGSDPAATEEFLAGLQARVERLSGNACQIYDSTQSEMESLVRSADPIVASWSRDARMLSGPVIIWS